MKILGRSVLYLLVYAILLGGIYPAVVTGLGQCFFRDNAHGSPIIRGTQVIGSKLIGQEFSEAKYFFSRPSATSSKAYNAESSSASNISLTNPAFQTQLQERMNRIGSNAPIPVDLVTASGSGLDPDISVAAARGQAQRIAAVRNIPEQKIQSLISEISQKRVLGIFGEPRVNVLLLNIKLDDL